MKPDCRQNAKELKRVSRNIELRLSVQWNVYCSELASFSSCLYCQDKLQTYSSSVLKLMNLTYHSRFRKKPAAQLTQINIFQNYCQSCVGSTLFFRPFLAVSSRIGSMSFFSFFLFFFFFASESPSDVDGAGDQSLTACCTGGYSSSVSKPPRTLSIPASLQINPFSQYLYETTRTEKEVHL